MDTGSVLLYDWTWSRRANAGLGAKVTVRPLNRHDGNMDMLRGRRRRAAALPVVGAMAVVLATPVAIDSARWWRSHDIAKRLRLSPQQVAAIDGIYQGSQAREHACARDSAAAREQLDGLLLSEGVDDVFEVATSRLADLEAACRRTRTLMLYRMFRELSPEQRLEVADLAGAQARPR